MKEKNYEKHRQTLNFRLAVIDCNISKDIPPISSMAPIVTSKHDPYHLIFALPSCSATAPNDKFGYHKPAMTPGLIKKQTIMLGKLNETQIEQLLKEQVIGRIACQAQGDLYLVPVNYVYKDGYVYSHSAEGKKIRMMRQNPAVCFEVEQIQSVFRWQTVIARGTYEEITDINEKQQAMQGIIHRIMPFVTSPEGHPSHGITEKDSDVGTNVELVVYRIRLENKSGRFEQS